MRVLHVSDGYLPRVGGIELHVRDLAHHQRRAGHDALVVTRTPAAFDVPDPGHVLRVGRDWGDWLADLAPDVVQAHVSIISPFALGTARRAALRGLPTVVTVHSLWTHAGPLPWLARDLLRMRGWPVTWCAVSQRAAETVRQLLGVPVHIVPNAVDLNLWTAAPGLPPGAPPHVLSVMRLTSVKRAVPLVKILRAVSRDTDLTATIVGDGPERPAVERYLRRHGLAERVRLTGTVDRAAVRRLLEGASVFLAPAHRESFGIAALEARATGVPVVASSRSGVATYVGHGREGLLGATDAELAAHTRALLRDHDLREQMAGHNRRVRPVHDWPTALVRTDEVYAQARLGARAGSRRRARGELVSP